MITLFSACIVGLHFLSMRQAMRQKGSKVKKLKSGEKSGNNPKGNELQFSKKMEPIGLWF